VSQSTNMSPKGEYNSLKEEYLHKKWQETRNFYLRKIKVLQQKIRRKDSRIIVLKKILDPLKKNNMLETEELQILQNIGGPNFKILDNSKKKKERKK
jgi:predicted RNase H-like nuclease (RuvC/YqgF family)